MLMRVINNQIYNYIVILNCILAYTPTYKEHFHLIRIIWKYGILKLAVRQRFQINNYLFAASRSNELHIILVGQFTLLLLLRVNAVWFL